MNGSSLTGIVNKGRNWTISFILIASLMLTPLFSVILGAQPAVKVLYQIADGSSLDDDGIADGNIVDPAGIAVLAASVGTPNTGLLRQNNFISIALLVLGATMMAYVIKRYETERIS